MLELKKVTKTFGKIKALEDISFSVDKGEFIFLTGSSGAGKTTLLRLILRELTPDSGEIILDGENILSLSKKKIPLLRQQMGVVFQDFKVLPERTVRENIEVALAVTGVPLTEWKARVDQVLTLVGLEQREYLFPSQLSGGEMQRTSLARALVVNPSLILADEPTGNLDWETAESIMNLFDKVNKEGKTVIIASHHKALIDEFGKRVIRIEDGRMGSDNVQKKKRTEKHHNEKQEKQQPAVSV